MGRSFSERRSPYRTPQKVWKAKKRVKRKRRKTYTNRLLYLTEELEVAKAAKDSRRVNLLLGRIDRTRDRLDDNTFK